ILILSLWRKDSGRFTLAGVRYLAGDLLLDPAGPRFRPVSGGQLDRGPCFYAPQVLHVGDRHLLWAWSWERGRPRAEIIPAGWAGTLTFCRELSLVDDTVLSRPAAELEALRRGPLAITA